jgi:hypothetical protein
MNIDIPMSESPRSQTWDTGLVLPMSPSQQCQERHCISSFGPDAATGNKNNHMWAVDNSLTLTGFTWGPLAYRHRSLFHAAYLIVITKQLSLPPPKTTA